MSQHTILFATSCIKMLRKKTSCCLFCAFQRSRRILYKPPFSPSPPLAPPPRTKTQLKLFLTPTPGGWGKGWLTGEEEEEEEEEETGS